jgi:hypothetical protein
MENQKVFIPTKRKAPNGYYWVSCTILPNGEKKCKCVMGMPISLTEVKLVGNNKYDDNWKPSIYGDGWFERNEKVNNVTFLIFRDY